MSVLVHPSQGHQPCSGEADPIVQCSDKNRAALIRCLEPNRRVEVEDITVERRVQ